MYSLIRRLAYSKRDEWHSRRADLFVELVGVRPGASVLDLGGQDGEFMTRVRERVDVRVTIADIGEEALARARGRGFETVALSEGERLPFDDGTFDVVFCNSVIEHVTLPKEECVSGRFTNREWVERSLESQRAFAREIERVGRGYFVQTPHRAFPVEAHTWLPLVGWMPHDATVRLVRLSDRYWVKHCGYVDWNLLDERDMRRLFPSAAIHVERVLGLPKSLIAYRTAL
jgi:hypothetical protein